MMIKWLVQGIDAEFKSEKEKVFGKLLEESHWVFVWPDNCGQFLSIASTLQGSESLWDFPVQRYYCSSKFPNWFFCPFWSF